MQDLEKIVVPLLLPSSVTQSAAKLSNTKMGWAGARWSHISFHLKTLLLKMESEISSYCRCYEIIRYIDIPHHNNTTIIYSASFEIENDLLLFDDNRIY